MSLRVAAVAGVLLFSLFVCTSGLTGDDIPAQKTEGKNKYLELLLEVYNEVVEPGSYESEGFIMKDFHINLDGNDTNKEEHVVVLVHHLGDRERMIVQVTYYKPRDNKEYIKYADDIRIIICSVKGGEVNIMECDYNEKELNSLLKKMLQGIRNKKELLKQIDRKEQSLT